MLLNLKRPLVFLDLETTELNIVEARIVEIGMIKITVDNEKIIYTRRLNPLKAISKEAYSIHHISNEDVKFCPTFQQVAKEIFNFIENSDLAGFNILQFDLPVLAEEFLRVGIYLDIENVNIIDVKNIFHKMEPRTLKGAYKFYCNKELTNAHSAEADAIATYEILLKQIEKYENYSYLEKGEHTFPIKNDVVSLSQFSIQKRFIDLAGHIILNDENIPVFNFGKYKNKSVVEVIKKEPQYYDWIMKSKFPEYTKLIVTEIIKNNRNKF